MTVAGYRWRPHSRKCEGKKLCLSHPANMPEWRVPALLTSASRYFCWAITRSWRDPLGGHISEVILSYGADLSGPRVVGIGGRGPPRETSVFFLFPALKAEEESVETGMSLKLPQHHLWPSFIWASWEQDYPFVVRRYLIHLLVLVLSPPGRFRFLFTSFSFQ